MDSHYSRLHPPTGQDASQEHFHNGDFNFSNTPSDVPLTSLKSNVEAWTRTASSNASTNEPQNKMHEGDTGFGRPDMNHRTTTGSFSIPSIASAPWEHKLNEKHIREVPTSTDTVRYFDRRRQTRRVFIDCVLMWCPTAFICGALAGTMYGFSTITLGLSQSQKYVYNALVTGLSIVLGLAFAAQFKQYAEMMRWRFLASQYRTLQDFELVLGCDSYRNTLALIFKGRPGIWYPSKSQLVAVVWFLIFIAFNVFTALLGLTYSIDVSETYVSVTHGNVSVANLQYIASEEKPNNGQDYDPAYQMAAANLWGEIGQNFPYYITTLDEYWSPEGNAVFTDNTGDLWWYRFVDLSPTNNKQNVVTYRTVASEAKCQEYEVVFGGYAGFNTDDPTLFNMVYWRDEYGQLYSRDISDVATGHTTWIGNSSSACGPRCAQILALQTANNISFADAPPDVVPVPTPRMWSCNNTVGQVAHFDQVGFENPDLLQIPDNQAFYLAGAIGWTGVTTQGDELQYTSYNGDSPLNPPGNTTAEGMAALVMKFTSGAVSAIDGLGGPRQNLTGPSSPGPAQVVKVKWPYAGAILVGIPTVQFLMLLGVVWFSNKAIILEPSYMTAAHLLYPVIQKVGKDGCLFTVEEMAQRLGDYRIAYGVRPDPQDPGHHDTNFVRDLDVIEESEGYGYIRGKMPEGRYD